MIRSMLAVILVIALAMSASAFDIKAYDILYTGDTAMTHDAGSFGVQASFLYFSANKEFDEDGESQDWMDDEKATGMWFPVNIYYGVMDNFEIGATPVFVMNKYEHPGLREAMEWEGTGIGDTWIWCKYMFMPEPMMTARLGFKVATGEDEPGEDELATGSGQMDIDGAVMFGVPAGPGSFDASVGYRYRMAKEVDTDVRSYDYKPGSEIHFFAGYTYYLSDMMGLRLGAEGYFGSDDEVDAGDREFEAIEDSGSNVVNINPGFDYMMDNGMSVGVDVFYPLMGTNVEAGWGAGITVGWGM